jgi:hypothetical protein
MQYSDNRIRKMLPYIITVVSSSTELSAISQPSKMLVSKKKHKPNFLHPGDRSRCSPGFRRGGRHWVRLVLRAAGGTVASGRNSEAVTCAAGAGPAGPGRRKALGPPGRAPPAACREDSRHLPARNGASRRPQDPGCHWGSGLFETRTTSAAQPGPVPKPEPIENVALSAK